MLDSLRNKIRFAWHAAIGNHEAFIDRTPSVYAKGHEGFGTIQRAMGEDLYNRCTIVYNCLSSRGKVVADALVELKYARIVIDQNGHRTIQAWGLLSQWLIGPFIKFFSAGNGAGRHGTNKLRHEYSRGYNPRY